jgi:hypothetical protein
MRRRSLLTPARGVAHGVEDVARASDETPGVGVDVGGEVTGDGVREACEPRERGDESSAAGHAPAPSAVMAQATQPAPARSSPTTTAPKITSAAPVPTSSRESA